MAALGLAAAVLIVSVDTLPAFAADPPTTTAEQLLIQRVPDGRVTDGTTSVTTTNLGTLVVVGNNDAYLTKTRTSGTGSGWTNFIHVDQFNTTSANTTYYTATLGGAPANLGHANGMTYYPTAGADPLEVGAFYVAMLKSVGSYQVAQINELGQVTAQFKARKGTVQKEIASIAHVSGNNWILGTGSENITDPNDPNQILKPYYAATLVGEYFELGNKFYVPTSTTYNIGQDIYYDATLDQLSVPVWDGQNQVGTATGRKNRVIVVELGTIVDGHVYSPVRWIDLEVPATSASQFELEGITRDANGKLLVSANVVKPDGTPADSIYKLVGISTS